MPMNNAGGDVLKLRLSGLHDPWRAAKPLLWLLPIGLLAFLIIYPVAELFLTAVEQGKHSLELLASARLLKVLVNTFYYTALTTVIGLALGLPLAWAFSRSDDRLSGFARTLVILGFVLPEFIYAIAYVFLLDPTTGYITKVIHVFVPGFDPPLYGLAGMSLLTGLFCVPQVVILVEPALRNVSADLEEAAEVSGSRTLNTMVRITLPLVMPAILTAALLTFLLAFASFGIPAALGIPAYFYVLSTEVYSVISNYPPRFDIAAVLSVVFLLIGLLAAAGQLYATRLAFRYRTIGGKGFRRRPRRLGRVAKAFRGIYIWTMVAMVSALPIAVIVAVSFASKWWQLPGNLTFDHYAFVLFRNPLLPEIASTTGWVTLLSVLGCLALALALGIFGTMRTRTIASFVVRLLGYVALSVPPIAFTVGALLAYVKPPLDLYGTMWILILTYWARFYPLAAGPIGDGLGQLDPALGESAAVAGAGAWRSFWQIQLPLIRPAVIAAALIVMMFTVRELLSAVFLQSSQVKMAMVSVFNYWDEGNFERAAAMSTVIVLSSALIFAFANRVQSRAGWRH